MGRRGAVGTAGLAAIALMLVAPGAAPAQTGIAESARHATQKARGVIVTVTEGRVKLEPRRVQVGPVRLLVRNRTANPRNIRIGGRKPRLVGAGEDARFLIRFRTTGFTPVAATVPGKTSATLTANLVILERGVKLTKIGQFTGSPVFVTAPPGDRRRLFVVEKQGRIRVYLDGRLLARPFLDIYARVRSSGNEQGLLSLAFAPDYGETGRFYVAFTDFAETIRVEEFRRSRKNPNRAVASTARTVLQIGPDRGEHYGGMLQFGPDGYLYASVGDGGLHRAYDPIRAQRLDDLNGKILRIDPRRAGTDRYRIPESNPFIGDGRRGEIWAYGLRNPWRFWIDPETEDLFIGDAGEFVRESIDYAPDKGRGTNFGWPCFEGGLPHEEFPPDECPGATPTLFEYAREDGHCAVIGGVVVRDPRLPNLSGRYVFSDFCKGELRGLRRTKTGRARVRSLKLTRPGITSFGEDARRRVYVTSLLGGVWRLDPKLTSSRQS